MRTATIPLLSSKAVPVIGTGALPLSNPRADGTLMPRDEAISLLHHAFDMGLRLVDTADIYAPSAEEMGHNERLVGEAVRTWSGGRDLVVVVTKIGITRVPGPPQREYGRDSSRDYLLRAAAASVSRLGFEPDVIVNHRVNREQQPFADTVRGMLAVREAGFARAIGLGNIRLDEALTAWEVSGGTIAAVENEACSCGPSSTASRTCPGRRSAAEPTPRTCPPRTPSSARSQPSSRSRAASR
jgi:aryl-alcohol dehydrogenase-like predicted oxidoreductase